LNLTIKDKVIPVLVAFKISIQGSNLGHVKENVIGIYNMRAMDKSPESDKMVKDASYFESQHY
jgi:hypothetical protein